MRKADFIIVCVVLVVLFLWAIFSNNGDSANVYVDGNLYIELSLKKDTQTVIKSDYGENTVVVKDGRVYVTESDCENKLCQKNSISKKGQSIICLPNRMSVIIEGNKRESEADILL